METIALAARLVLALVFAVSGATKLRHVESTAASATALGLSQRWSRRLAPLLAPAELGVAALLLPGITAYASVVTAAVSLVAFTALIGASLARGSHPPCACFGESTEPISLTTLLRDFALVATALSAAAPGPARIEGAVSGIANRVGDAGISAALAVLLLAVAAEGVAILAFVGRRSSTAPTPHSGDAPRPEAPLGWPVGSRAPDFSLERTDGIRVSLGDLLRREKPVALLFTDESCTPCRALMPEVADWQEEHSEALTIAVVASGGLDQLRLEVADLKLVDLLVQGDGEVTDAYRCSATPGAVLVGRDGAIASRVVIGASGVRSLVAAAAFDARPPHSIPRRRPERLPQQLPVGVLAPQVQLPSLDGSEVDVSEFRGRMLVLLFWSPSCGYCAALRPDLVEWIRSERHVQLVGIASGGRVANEVQRLGAPILLEDDGATLAAFGASGTPSAVLIDAAGYVASPLAVGGEEVRAVLDRARALGSIASRSATNSARASRADGATEPSLASHRSPEARPSPPELAK